MGVAEPEMLSYGEVQSQLHSDSQSKNNQQFSMFGRQPSIYSLTLDEFQHTLCEGGKNFGSMNMDEFLTSIWNAEENNQGINSSQNHNNYTSHRNNNSAADHLSGSESSTERKITKQPSLPRQGSLTIPTPLCRKTVDEVWSEIHKGRQQQSRNNNQTKNHDDKMKNSESAPRQPTFGEMTLEDFLVKAGVVREPCPNPMVATEQQKRHYATHPTSPSGGPTFTPATEITGGLNKNGSSNVVAPYPQVSQSSGPIWEGSGTGYQQQVPPFTAVCYGGRIVNGGVGYPAAPGIPVPLSPVSSEGLCTSQVDNSTSQYGMDMGALRGRKRMVDGPVEKVVEKVVERRQRRMIKNRESAARSRARKQAYTVELEAELNQLREENAQLKEALEELERKRKQQNLEEAKMKASSKAQKHRPDRLRKLRRNLSFPL